MPSPQARALVPLDLRPRASIAVTWNIPSLLITSLSWVFWRSNEKQSMHSPLNVITIRHRRLSLVGRENSVSEPHYVIFQETTLHHLGHTHSSLLEQDNEHNDQCDSCTQQYTNRMRYNNVHDSSILIPYLMLKKGSKVIYMRVKLLWSRTKTSNTSTHCVSSAPLKADIKIEFYEQEIHGRYIPMMEKNRLNGRIGKGLHNGMQKEGKNERRKLSKKKCRLLLCDGQQGAVVHKSPYC